ncbi:spherulation-specific family 4 protein [Granulicella paludicola]|uniref:spherulation-specific family 4 protein n=1 Tax=Granulicella paludicola TaxID=474951 RepID=UPI0021E0ED1B|nr:spherulation-specific family 4 protein [Granulicella paludicola]
MKTQAIAAAVAMSGLLALVGCTGVSEFGGKTSTTGTTTSNATGSTCQSIAIPTYIYPSYLGSGWNVGISDSPWNKDTKRIFIMNPGSGPGTAANSDYQNIVTKVHNAGGLVYGYVYTNYGAVSLASAETQATEYKTWYNVDGIFVDAASSDPALVSTYYQPFANYITTQTPTNGVMLNAGDYPDPSYAKITVPTTSALTIVTYEGDYTDYLTTVVPAWANTYPASMFVHLVYNVPAANLANVLTLSAQRNVGNIFVTDQALPNPYGALPSYWAQLVAQTQAACK